MAAHTRRESLRGASQLGPSVRATPVPSHRCSSIICCRVPPEALGGSCISPSSWQREAQLLSYIRIYFFPQVTPYCIPVPYMYSGTVTSLLLAGWDACARARWLENAWRQQQRANRDSSIQEVPHTLHLIQMRFTPCRAHTPTPGLC